MQKFGSLNEAKAFVVKYVDKPVNTMTEHIEPGVKLGMSTYEKEDGTFTNVYDLAIAPNVKPEIITFDSLTSVYRFLTDSPAPRYSAATGGGFFYLADRGSNTPRQLALNLSISDGNIRSLPVVDREAVLAMPKGLEVRHVVALGSMSLNGNELEWSGSLTEYDTAIKVYSNGNAVINHQPNAMTDTCRVLDESSRYTPPIANEDFIDVGFIGRGDNNFIGVGGSTSGNVDIFAHDFVVRCHERYFEGNSELQVHTIGDFALSELTGGGFSAGPDLHVTDFPNHPVNNDKSLGSRPPFADTCLARIALYKSNDGIIHIRLYDGRPGSSIFPGVTPAEVVSHILSQTEIEWGCFIDPGQTAKLCVRTGPNTISYGNRHYLQWPSEGNPDFLWVPNFGRPVANAIVI